MRVALAVLVVVALASAGCRDPSRFSSKGDRFEGSVVKGSFVRSGVGEDVRLCMTLDAERVQDAPGTITTSDGRFQAAPLRPIPQIWHDPLSTLNFGDGRVQNLVYAASPSPGDGGEAEAQDVMVIVSLMQTDHVEVRLIRGAPQTDAGPPPPGTSRPLFGVFNLYRQLGPCEF
ncbi:MAG: hypothetical protein KIS78_21485 [Labilithrix sp.]|nr:hypothetical protein [Labilithrix sp.]MCW5834987.1 hypothetical protein [Labilithrix sp.]